MARYPEKETPRHKRERKIIKDLAEKEERRRLLNKDAAARCRQKTKNTIEELRGYVEELNQLVIQKDSEIRNLKMKLESVEETLSRHQCSTTEQMVPVIQYPTDQAAMYAVLSPSAVPFTLEHQQSEQMTIQPMIPILNSSNQPQYYVLEQQPFDNLSQTQFINQGLIFCTPSPIGSQREPKDQAYQLAANESPIQFNPAFIWGLSPTGVRKEPIVPVLVPAAPKEAPIYQELTASTRQESVEAQEAETFDRPEDLPPTSQQSFQKPSSSSVLTPDSLRIQACLFSIGATPDEFKRIFRSIQQRDASA